MEKYEVLYKGLPKCYLFDTLYKKWHTRYDIDFDFFGVINKTRQRVSAEVGQINRLFPEYTPHDEDYHLKRLFNVTDIILGKKLIESMNSTELLILACGLYTHDWGMAVSNSEKEFIISLEENQQKINDDLWILDNERDLFEQYLHQQGVKRGSNKISEQITDEIWRNYIRQTHALRSGKRAFKFFEKDDLGLANSVAKVCVGHWLDSKDLRKYSSNFTVLNENVNIRALAIYVRLIDLLDLTNYRTPYVIWKFVAPRNTYSKMEWDKHRAIQSLSPRDYQQGRVIQINGVTNDHEVYASLEDLKVWCNEQFRECNDLLAEMNDSRHKLDIYHIDWEIETDGFKRVNIRFEFDREKMFEILAEEIYQNDSYVFLRELLQNSIDAIRMRRALLKDRGIKTNNTGVIRVEVEHLDNGNANINWIDDGIGMNEHIVKNYLAVVGRSYYGSDEFKNEGLNIDPISRFGIGLLSCFAVAKQIEIYTCRDPYIDSSNQLLKIVIPSVTNCFRIEPQLNNSNFVGTKVRILVDGKKILKDNESGQSEKLNVTKYLSIIAGFVEFPIIVNEGELKTIILHPKANSEDILKQYGKDYRAYKLPSDYPWEEVFLPQDLLDAKEVFRQENNDISILPDLEGYEGTISYLLPKDGDMDLIISRDIGEKIISIKYRNTKKTVENKRIRIEENLLYRSFETEGLSKSSRVSPFFAVYRDGILISDVQTLDKFDSGSHLDSGIFFPSKLSVNIPKSKTQKVDLARIHILGKSSNWVKPIRSSFVKEIISRASDGLINSEPFERLYKMCRLSAYYQFTVSEIWDYFPHDYWPVLFLFNNGHISACNWNKINEDRIYEAPDIINKKIKTIIYDKLYNSQHTTCLISEWVGDTSFISINEYFYSNVSSFSSMQKIITKPFKELYQLTSIRFLSSPFDSELPLFQNIWQIRQNEDKISDKEFVFKKAIEDPLNLTIYEKSLFCNSHFGYKYHLPDIIEFDKPFEKYCAYGWRVINFNHSLGQFFVRIISFLELTKQEGNIPLEQIGYLKDIIRNLPYYDKYSLKAITYTLQAILSKVNELRLFELKNINQIIPSPNDFVPGTIFENKGDYYLITETYKERAWNKTSFGITLS